MRPLEHDLVAADSPLSRGATIERFVVIGLVGRGSMGEVYAAHDPQLDRRVAIKLLRREHGHLDDSDRAAERLIREAQAIAKISDPNVVVVYDVGRFRDRVFIAMEFIEGYALNYWLQVKPRGMGEILQVFLAAGRGLAAAHDQGIVHRDFKPDNVMVSHQGQVRVVDFGLAGFGGDALPVTLAPQPRGPNDSRDIALTQSGVLVGTPAYMSPEQFQGAPVDGRTDQFSFCVALYESLHHQRPFGGSTLKALAANVVSGHSRSPAEGSLVPAAIRRALSRGLMPDVNARFPSMRALLAALDSEQTLLGSRGFAADAAAKLAGVWEAPAGASTADTSTKAEMRRAFLATGKPYAAASFEATSRILDRFALRWTELYVDCCEATHIRGEQPIDVLDLRMGALREALANLRALCHELGRATSATAEKAVEAANALGNLERCSDLELLRAVVRPPEDPVTRASVERLQAGLAGVRALAHLGRVAAGLKEVVALEEEARRLNYPPLLAEILFTSGVMHYDVGNLDGAARVLEDAVWTAELCRHDEVAAEAAANLVFVTGYAQSRFEVGEIWSRHAETILARMSRHDLIRGWLLNNRGAMRATQGRLREAVDDLGRATTFKEKALGPDDPDVASSLTNTAIFLDELGDTAAAAEYAERAVAIMETTLGLNHPKAAIPLTNYAELLVRLGRFEEARGPAERALALFERESDPDGLFVTYPLSTLGVSYIGLGQFDLALAPLERAVRIREAKESIPAKRAEAQFALARALAGAGHSFERAGLLAVRAREIYRSSPATPATERERSEIERWLAANAPSGVGVSDPLSPATSSS